MDMAYFGATVKGTNEFCIGDTVEVRIGNAIHRGKVLSAKREYFNRHSNPKSDKLLYRVAGCAVWLRPTNLRLVKRSKYSC